MQYWQITYERGIQTMAVWDMVPTFQITGTTLAQHTTRINSLPTLAQARDMKELDLAGVRAVRQDLFAKLDDLNIRVPNTIDGAITDDDNLHGQLDLVYAASRSKGQASILDRARLVSGVWTDYNAQLAAETPTRGPLIVKYVTPGSIEEPEEVTQADFAALITTALTTQQAEKDAQRDLTNAKTDLRVAERRADRDNKRWYKAWTEQFPEGTAEGDAARSQVTTEQGTAAPEPIEIASAALESGNGVFIQFVPGGGAHATTKELLYKLGGEADFGHTTPITGDSMHVGPFTGGQTVTFVTRVANSTTGNVLGTPFPVVIPA